LFANNVKLLYQFILQHNWPTAPLGAMRVKAGPLMAHVSQFEICITGKGTHGSQPQLGVDPVLVGAHVVTALHSIVSRSLHYKVFEALFITSLLFPQKNCFQFKDSAVVSVTMFHAGEVSNVIADTATLGGTIRDFDASVFNDICRRLEEIVHGTCAAFGAKAKITIKVPIFTNCSSCMCVLFYFAVMCVCVAG